jgi:O-antigen ligase
MSGPIAQMAVPPSRMPTAIRTGYLRDIFTTAYLLMLCGTLYSIFVVATPAGAIMEKAGSSSSYTALWMALYALLLVYLRRELINPFELIARNRWFVLFVLSAGISFVFSPPAMQLVVTKLAMFVLTLLFGLYLARNYTVSRFISLFIALSAMVFIAHWLIYPMQSHLTYDRMERATLLGINPYGGLFGHKNLAGTFFGLSFLACYGRAIIHRGRLRYALLAFGHAVSLIAAGAAGALLCAVVGALVMTGFILTSRRSKLAPLFFIAIALALVAIAAVGTAVILHAVGRDAGMSGRWRVFEVWPNYFWQHPLFGWGYSNFFTGQWNEPAEALRTLTPYHARYFTFESAYLEVLIDFGLIGGGFFFAMMATGFRNAITLALHPEVPYSAVPLGWLVFIAAMSISDSGLRIHNLVTAALVAWTYFGLAVQKRTAAATTQPTWRLVWTPS